MNYPSNIIHFKTNVVNRKVVIFLKKCLICKERNIDYYGICTSCKILNQNMRSVHADLNGYTALITGARVRIGYATALRLLRDGANVIGITRFPHIAMENYKKEPDYQSFKDRLKIIGFDLMQIHLLDDLISKIESYCPNGLDILINNSAQTIRKSPTYYLHRIELDNQLKLEASNSLENSIVAITPPTKELLTQCVPVPNVELSNYNSWVAKPEDIAPQEMLEVQLINVTAPFFLTTRLKPLMLKSEHLNRFIINVSSVEGRFNDYNKGIKLSRHIHTNMAKASLNMMTHSLAYDYSKDRIYIYSCDPGWITSQFPADFDNNKNFKPYLTLDDGACRLCYPIYLYINELNIKDIGSQYKYYKIIAY